MDTGEDTAARSNQDQNPVNEARSEGAASGNAPGAVANAGAIGTSAQAKTTYRILFAISLAHLCNDTMQSVVPAMFPVVQDKMALTYTQIGLIYFMFQLTASIMQPVFGLLADRRPMPFFLPLGMVLSLIGMLLLGVAPVYPLVLVAVVFVGLGSAVFHPEGSRVSHLAAGARKGLAQSIFQVGGNTGSSMQPVIARWVLLPMGQIGAVFFTAIAGAGIFIQLYVAKWYRDLLRSTSVSKKAVVRRQVVPDRKHAILFSVCLLIVLVLIRSWYSAAISSFYTLYLEKAYGMTLENAQFYLLVYLLAGAVGTFFGGPIADRFGRRNLMFFSMVGAAPFALFVPFAPESWLFPLLALNGFIMSSSFAVTVVYAQSLMPGKIGLVSGLITGLAFGLGGVGALSIGGLIDIFGISLIIQLCGLLPLLGLLTYLLPSDKKIASWTV